MIEKDKTIETIFNNEMMKNIFNNKIFQGIFISFLIILALFLLKMIFYSMLMNKGANSAVKSGGNIGGLRLFTKQ